MGQEEADEPLVLKSDAELKESFRRTGSLINKLDRQKAGRQRALKKLSDKHDERIAKTQAELDRNANAIRAYATKRRRRLLKGQGDKSFRLPAGLIRWYDTAVRPVIGHEGEQSVIKALKSHPGMDRFIRRREELNRTPMSEAKARRSLTALKIPGLSFRKGKFFSLSPDHAGSNYVRDEHAGTWELKPKRKR